MATPQGGSPVSKRSSVDPGGTSAATVSLWRWLAARLRRVGRRFTHTVRGRLLLLVLVILIPIFLVQAGIFANRLQAWRNEGIQANLELARAVAAAFDAYVDGILRQELTLGQALTADTGPSAERANRLLAASADGCASLLHLSWADDHGRILGSSSAAAVGGEVGDQPYFQEILSGRGWVVSDLYLQEPDGWAVFAIARGMRDEEGTLQGVIVAVVDPQQLGKVLPIARAGGGAIAIIDRQGRGVYRYPVANLTWERRDWVKTQPIIARALEAGEVSGTFLSVIDRQQRLAGLTPIRSLGWLAGANRPMPELMDPACQQIARELWAFLAVVAVALVLASHTSQSLSRPILRLREHALAIGRGELGRPAEVQGPAELRELAAAFNRMAEEIRQREEEQARLLAALQEANGQLAAASVQNQELANEAQAARQRAEQRAGELSAVFSALTDAVLICDSSGRLQRVNPAAQEAIGCACAAQGVTGEALIARISLRHLDGRPLTVEEMPCTRALHGEAVAGERYLATDAGGHDRIVVVSASPLAGSGNATAGAVIVSHDVTEREQLLSQLAAERGRLEAVLQQMPAGVVIAEAPSGRLLLANRQAERILRYRFLPPAGTKRYLWQRDLPHRRAYRPEEWPLARSIAAGEIVAGEELDFQRGDGSRGTLSISSAPIRDRQGRIVAGVVTFHDISERKRAEEANHFLAEASQVLAGSLDYETTLQRLARLVIPTLADWCVVDMVEGQGLRLVAVTYVDPAKEEIAREIIRRCPPDPNASEPYRAVLASGEPYLVPEVSAELVSALADDGEQLAMMRELGLHSLMLVPLVVRGQILGILSLSTTTSGRHYGPPDLALAQELARRAALAVDNARLYREAQAAIRARDEFLSVAAHELRTPITSLRGFAQVTIRHLAKEGVPDPQRVHRALQAVDQQSGRLAHLVSQLLDVSRIDAGRLALDRQLTDLAALVREAAATAQTNSTRHQIVVQAPSPVMALVDPLRIEQVVVNLIDNAIRYSPEGGAIEVELSLPDPTNAQLVVRDHGIGIAPEHCELIFDRFYQVHTGSGGMGLGLYISRHIVDLHGGRIVVEAPPDGGSRFVVTLPIGLVVPHTDSDR